MTEVRVESRDNATLKLARAVRDGRERALMFVEGVRLGEEALGVAELRVEALLYAPEVEADERAARLVANLRRRARRTYLVAENLLASVADTKTTQGVIALVERPRSDAAQLEESLGEIAAPLLLVLHGVGVPANAGSIVRTAEAAGVSGLIATRGTVDLFSPKALRGAMGSSFRLPAWVGPHFAEAIEWCGARGVRTISAAGSATLAHTAYDWTQGTALVVGAEGGGLAAEDVALTDASVHIPMRPPVESLNVAVASGVILYEALRQRSS